MARSHSRTSRRPRCRTTSRSSSTSPSRSSSSCAAIGDYYWFGIASPTQITAVGNENLAANPSGTGPFKFVERVEGDHTTVERFEEYWGEKAYLDRLIVRPILDDAARVVALQNGEIDLMSDPPPDTIPDLLSAGFKMSEGNASQVAYYNFNFRNEYGANDLGAAGDQPGG